MPVMQCRTCGDIVPDPSRLCSSCGNMNEQPQPPAPKSSGQSFTKPLSFNRGNGDVSKFSVRTVVSRSFSTLCKHPFVFIGLSLFGIIPGSVITVFTQNSLIRDGVVWVLSSIMWATFQGAIAYGVFETLRGNVPQFGKSMSNSMAHIASLTLVSLLVFGVLIMLYYISTLFHTVVQIMAVLIGPHPLEIDPHFLSMGTIIVTILMTLMKLVVLCKWDVFVQVCVFERLGPAESLSRSSYLTKGCRLKIAALYAICGVIALVVVLVSFPIAWIISALPMSMQYLIVAALAIIAAAPIAALIHVITSITYFELRAIKERAAEERKHKSPFSHER